jgi:hypothetical protein
MTSPNKQVVASIAQNKNKMAVHNPPDRLLTPHEIARALRMFMWPERKGEHRIVAGAIATMAGVDRITLWRYATQRRRMSEYVQSALSPIIRDIEAGKLRFRRAGREWQIEEAPARLPPPQDRLVRATDWNEWARCRSCGGWRFTEVSIHGTRWFLCDTCLPWQTAGIGAQPVDRTRLLPR